MRVNRGCMRKRCSARQRWSSGARQRWREKGEARARYSLNDGCRICSAWVKMGRRSGDVFVVVGSLRQQRSHRVEVGVVSLV